QAWSVPFGAVGFTPEGIPGSTILIYRALTGLGTVEIEGVHARQWPTSLRNRVLGRMIGRVLAHEIGHWVLRTRQHSRSGLMRSMHTTDSLADSSRHAFGLMPGDVRRLQQLIARAQAAR